MNKKKKFDIIKAIKHKTKNINFIKFPNAKQNKLSKQGLVVKVLN